MSAVVQYTILGALASLAAVIGTISVRNIIASKRRYCERYRRAQGEE